MRVMNESIKRSSVKIIDLSIESRISDPRILYRSPDYLWVSFDRLLAFSVSNNSRY